MTDEERCFLLIEFEEEGSAKFNVTLEKISPIQMLGIAQWMEFEAKHQLSMEKAALFQQRLQQEQLEHIAVPGKEEWKNLQ